MGTLAILRLERDKRAKQEAILQREAIEAVSVLATFRLLTAEAEEKIPSDPIAFIRSNFLTASSKVVSECVEVEAWLREKKQHHSSLSKYPKHVFLSQTSGKKPNFLTGLTDR